MLYQFYDITYDYLLYPYYVKLNVLYENEMHLPSITICTPKGIIWSKSVVNNSFHQMNEYFKLNQFKNCYQNKSCFEEIKYKINYFYEKSIEKYTINREMLFENTIKSNEKYF